MKNTPPTVSASSIETISVRGEKSSVKKSQRDARAFNGLESEEAHGVILKMK